MLGHDAFKDSFCYWLETKTRELGSISGGSASKFGIYWSQEDNNWRYNKIYENADDAREKLTNGIATLVEAAQEKQSDELDAIGRKLLGKQSYSMRIKPLSLYFPNEILPISSLNHLKFFLSLFEQASQGEATAHNRQLLQWMQAQPEFKDFDSYGLMRFLYDAFPASKGKKDESLEGHTMKKFPLNQILYGPPGTGKTYSTIQRAVQIIEGDKSDHPAYKARFDELSDEGRIAFVTFHQSFSYEDFVEGIRPSLEGDGTARYELRDGILKEMALRALSNCLKVARGDEATFEGMGCAVRRENETPISAGLWLAD